jgi:hypothetical protein
MIDSYEKTVMLEILDSIDDCTYPDKENIKSLKNFIGVFILFFSITDKESFEVSQKFENIIYRVIF